MIEFDVTNKYKFEDVESFAYLNIIFTRKLQNSVKIKASIAAGTKSAAVLRNVQSNNKFI